MLVCVCVCNCVFIMRCASWVVFFLCLCVSRSVWICAVPGLTCTLRTSSEFCEVSSSICLCNSATVPGSPGAGEGLAESVSAWEVASSWAGEALERFESSFSRGKVHERPQHKSISVLPDIVDAVIAMWYNRDTCMLCARARRAAHTHTYRIPGKSNISSMSSESLTPIPWPPFSSSSSLSLSASASARRCFSWDSCS